MDVTLSLNGIPVATVELKDPLTGQWVEDARRQYKQDRDPPTDSDFRSQRAEKPSYRFRGVTECQVRGLSVFAARQDAERALRLPNLRGCLLCRVQLEAGAGHIQQTGRPSHHTWWPLAAFNILARCGMETL